MNYFSDSTAPGKQKGVQQDNRKANRNASNKLHVQVRTTQIKTNQLSNSGKQIQIRTGNGSTAKQRHCAPSAGHPSELGVRCGFRLVPTLGRLSIQTTHASTDTSQDTTLALRTGKRRSLSNYLPRQHENKTWQLL